MRHLAQSFADESIECVVEENIKL